jgi:hypothetical protein
MSDFPVVLSNCVDGDPPTGTEIIAKFINNLEAKVGIDSSAVVTSLDYLLKNSASINPGHKHSKLWASDGSPEAVTVDAAGNVGFGTTPQERVEISLGATGCIYLSNAALTQPVTSIAPTNVSGKFRAYDSGGGLAIWGLTQTDTTAFSFLGISGSANPTSAVYRFIAGKTNGSVGWGALDSLETAFAFDSYTTRLVTILGNSNFGIGTNSPSLSGTGKLHMAADTMRLDTLRTPASAGAAGNAGEICADANYFYHCVATNSWTRAAKAAW